MNYDCYESFSHIYGVGGREEGRTEAEGKKKRVRMVDNCS